MPSNNDGPGKSRDTSGSTTGKSRVARTPKAVAIADSQSRESLPRVVATGHGSFAEQILQVAWANDIKVREDADLVEVLAAIDVDSEIPLEAFAAVAEILSYVYRANAGMSAAGGPTES